MSEHVVIPLSSALRLRDEAIRYGGLKGLQVVSLGVAVGAALAALLAMQFYLRALLLSATAWGLIGLVVACLVWRQLEYPHFPRVAEEELEEMREMGIPPAVVKGTEQSVLVGSLAALEAMRMSSMLIAQLRRAGTARK